MNKSDYTPKSKLLRDLYTDQLKNSVGDAVYGITVRLSQYEAVKAEILSTDFSINEIDLNHREIVLTGNEYPNRVPSDPSEIRKLPFIQKGYMRESTFNFIRKKLRTMRENEDFEIDISHLNDREIVDLHGSLHIFQDIQSDVFIYKDKSVKYKKCLRVALYHDRLQHFRKNWGWSELYLHFTLRKVNLPFRHALSVMAKALNKNPQDFQFAQVKEAKSVSYQKVSVKLPSWHAVQKLVSRKEDFKVGNFVVKEKPLEIGALKGNKHRMVIHLEPETVPEVKKVLNHLKETGFVNYFGAKRFFYRKNVPVHEIGRALLSRNWQEALELILRPTFEDVSSAKILVPHLKERFFLLNGNTEKVLAISLTSDDYEYRMIRKLHETKGNYLAALEEVPFNLRMGYVVAYQSYIWNVIASQRIKRKGLKLVEGDIVVTSKRDAKSEFLDDYGILVYSGPQPYVAFKAGERQIFDNLIHFVTAADVKENKYSIHDLVLPTPGSDVVFPKADVGTWYSDLLSKDKVTLAHFEPEYSVDGERVVNSYILRGTYRRVLLNLDGFSWNFKSYKTAENTEKPALHLEFTLKPDAYVMIALRELFDDVTVKCEKVVESAVVPVPVPGPSCSFESRSRSTHEGRFEDKSRSSRVSDPRSEGDRCRRMNTSTRSTNAYHRYGHKKRRKNSWNQTQ